MSSASALRSTQRAQQQGLLHTVRARRGLTSSAVLLVSLVLATLRDQSVERLTEYRHLGDRPGGQCLRRTPLGVGLHRGGAVAAEQSDALMAQIAELRTAWTVRVAPHRASLGVRETPRANSATARLLRMLPEAPGSHRRHAAADPGVSFPVASSALEELRGAGILDTRTIKRNATAYVATEVLDLVAMAERRLASTKFDTRVTSPNRPVPARPHRDAPQR